MNWRVVPQGDIAPPSARCPDIVERAVFIHNHEITADGLQLGDELRATHKIDGLNAPRFGNGDKRPAA